MQFFENENFAARALGEICHFFGIDLIKRLAFQKSQKSAKSLHPTVRGGPRPRFELGTGDLYYVLVHTYILA